MKKILITSLASLLLSLFGFGQNSLLPASITFERTVVQQSNGEDGKGTVTYYFTINGDYAMIKKEDGDEEENATMLYTKEGAMCMVNEKAKTIIIMNTAKALKGASDVIKKELDKKPLPAKKNDDKIAVTKTGKTKVICGYTSYEYQIKTEDGSSNWWYALVDFNPIKIYTMGIGNNNSSNKIENNPAMKNNPAAIPVINKNFLMAEVEVAGKKSLETKSISTTAFTFDTTSYSIKELKKASE